MVKVTLIHNEEDQIFPKASLDINIKKNQMLKLITPVNLENTNDSQPITLGHPTKGIVVGQLILDDCDDTGLENSCQQFAAILSDMGLDKNSLVELAYCLVKVNT